MILQQYNIQGMSVEIRKKVKVYEEGLSFLKAKSELLAAEPQNAVSVSLINFNKYDNSSPVWIAYLGKSLQTVLQQWIKKYSMFACFKSNNVESIKLIQSRAGSLKESTTLLSKENSLLLQLQDQMKQWNNISDPFIYYDVNKRESVKKGFINKIKQFKNSSQITKQSSTRLFSKRIEEQLCKTIYEAHLSQAEVNRQIVNRSKQEWVEANKMVYIEDKQFNSTVIPSYIAEEKDKFCTRFEQAMFGKKVRLSKELFDSYYKSISLLTKNVHRFWCGYLQAIKEVSSMISNFVKKLRQCKQDLDQRQLQSLKLLQKSNPAINRAFAIQIILKIIAQLNQMFEMLPMLSQLETQMLRSKSVVEKNIKYSDQYFESVGQQFYARQKQYQFSLFAQDDRNFLQANLKTQNSIRRKVGQIYVKMLAQCSQISIKNAKIFSTNVHHCYSFQEITNLLDRQLSDTNYQNKSSQSVDKSRISTAHSMYSGRQNQKSIKDQKITEFQNFINKIEVFDPSNINWHRNNVFSCALGPQFLLHGKIVILNEGIYYYSLFNKKNVFFGKTRIFVPREEILQINSGSSLLIFPDKIQVKTKVGSLYFHSLGSRQTIQNTLNEIYFSENCIIDQMASQVDFKQCNEEKLYSQSEIKQLVKPYENKTYESVVKDITVQKYFKRYLSDEPFEYRGQKYDNFRTYFLLQIEAKDPTSTKITPPPPQYLQYKSEKEVQDKKVKTSERVHTFKKAIPKIPFLSSGGDGICEDKQVYHWISPNLIVVAMVSKVKGFSLVQSMEVHSKLVVKQEGNDVMLTFTSYINFITQASTDGLIKGPAMSNLKQSTKKMIDIIERNQRMKKNRKEKNQQNNNAQDSEILEETVARLKTENTYLKRKFNITVALLVFIYLVTFLMLRHLS